jgi:hypothetical protein
LYIQVYAEHDDYVGYSGGYALSMIRKNETVGERPFFERLKLPPASPITGKVVSPSGEPLAGVKLFGFTAIQPVDLNNNRWLDATTLADGSFRLNMIKGGVAYFWVLPNDYSIVQKFVSDSSVDVGEIRLPEGIRLRGRALSAEGTRTNRWPPMACYPAFAAARSQTPRVASRSIRCRPVSIASCRRINRPTHATTATFTRCLACSSLR